MQLANALSFSVAKFVVRGFSQRHLLATCLALVLSQGCAMLQRPAEVPPSPQPPPPESPVKKRPPAEAKLPQTGEASWYGAQHQGKQTASGQIFDPAQFTAAHRTLPFGSRVKVTNLANGRSVEVEINDRGPFAENRIIDLSQAAAKALGMTLSGTTTVRLELPSSP